MKAIKKAKVSLSELREKAEKKLLFRESANVNESLVEIEHELNVHKIELEMQNEELRVTQLKLEHSLENYSELFEFAPIGYFILDRNGVIENLNDTGSNLIGIYKSQVMGKPFSIFLFTEECQDNFYRHRNTVVETGKMQQIECKIRRKDNTVFPVQITSTSIKDKYNQFKHFLCTVSDITERLEQERKVQLALERERELNELKSRFIATASHEFRTPLATILLSAELLEMYNSSSDAENRKKHFNKIKSSIKGLTEILIDFLTINKFEDGFVKNNPELLNLVKFSKNVIEEINIEKHPVVYHHTGEKGLVKIDPKLLKLCLSNLVGNAIKYSTKKIAVTITSHVSPEGTIVFEIKDKGIGIPDCDKPYIFDQFFRAKNAETFPGTGLGLNIVQKFIEVMNGEISFTSKENEGSVFVLKFNKAQ